MKKTFVSLISILSLIVTMLPAQALGRTPSFVNSNSQKPELSFPKISFPKAKSSLGSHKNKESENNKSINKLRQRSEKVNNLVKRKKETGKYKINFPNELTSVDIRYVLKAVNNKYGKNTIAKEGNSYILTLPRGVSLKEIENEINEAIKDIYKQEALEEKIVSFSDNLNQEQINIIVDTINKKYKKEVLHKNKDGKYILALYKGVSFEGVKKDVEAITKNFYKKPPEIDENTIGYLFQFKNVSQEEIASICSENGIEILHADTSSGKYILKLPTNMSTKKAVEIFNSAFQKEPAIELNEVQNREENSASQYQEYQEGVLIVKFKEGTTQEEIDKVNAKYNTSIQKLILKNHGLIYLLNIKDELSVIEKVAQFKKESIVEYAEPNYIVSTDPPGQDNPSQNKSVNIGNSQNLTELSDSNSNKNDDVFFDEGEANGGRSEGDSKNNLIEPIKQKNYIEGELIVKYKEGTTSDEIDEINARLETSVKRNLSGLNTYLLNIEDKSLTEEKINQYKSEEKVEYAEANYIVSTQPAGEPQKINEDPANQNNNDGAGNQDSSQGSVGETPVANLNPNASKKMFFYTGDTNLSLEGISLAEDSQNPDSLKASAPEFDVALPRELSPTSNDYFAFKLKGENKGIRFKPQVENSATGVIVENSVIYKNIINGVDLKFDIKEDFLKEIIVLNNKPSSNIFSFDFETFGDIYYKEEDKKIVFYDSATSKALFNLPPLFMYDKNNNYNHNIETKITNTADKLKLQFILDDTWLKDPARAYPVIVDPPVFLEETETDPKGAKKNNNEGDTYVNYGPLQGVNQNKNFSSDYVLFTGSSGAYYDWGVEGPTYSLLRFNISKLRGGTIYKANLYLYPLYQKTPINNSTLNQLSLQAVDSSFSIESVTWNNKPSSGQRWSTNATEVMSDGWIRFDVKGIIKQWANNSYPNNGFLLHTLDDANSAYFKVFASAEYGGAAPTLEVEYDHFPASSVVSPTGGQRYEKSRPDFKFTYKDSDGDEIKWAYIQVATNPSFSDGSTPGSKNSIAAVYNLGHNDLAPYQGKDKSVYQNGVSIDYTPASGLTALTNGLYYWRAVLGDGYTDPQDNNKAKKVYSNVGSFKVLAAPQFSLDISQPGSGSGINSASPTFTWTVTDPDINSGEYLESWLRWSNNPDFINNGSDKWVRQSWWTNLANNQKLTFKITPSLTDGEYYFRLEVWDSIPASTVAWHNTLANWSWSASTPISGDFNGDGRDDMAIVYGYGGNQTKIHVFTSKSSHNGGNYSYSFTPDGSSVWWDSGPGNFNANNAKFTVGDFNHDGASDLIAFYNLGGARTKMLGFYSDYRDPNYRSRFNDHPYLWDSGSGNWEWSASKIVAGDFNGDHWDDIAVQYAYGGAQTRLFIFLNNARGFNKPVSWWNSGKGNWDGNYSFPVVGDFNQHDGKDDIALLYYYLSQRQMRIFIFLSKGNAFYSPRKWYDSGSGNWDYGITKLISGDFDADKRDDIGVFYGYAGSRAKIHLFLNSGLGDFKTFVWWDSGDGNWNGGATKIFTGDYDGDGRSNMGSLYGYFSNNLIRSWVFYNKPLNKRSVDGYFIEKRPDLTPTRPFNGQSVSAGGLQFQLKALSFDSATTITLKVFKKNTNGSKGALIYTKTLTMNGGQNQSQYYKYLNDIPGFSLPDGNYIWEISTSDNLNSWIYKDRSFTIKSVPKIKNIKVLSISSTGFIKQNQPSFSFTYESKDNIALLNTVLEIGLTPSFSLGHQIFNLGNLTSFTLPKILKDGRYYYRLRVFDDHNNPSAWSQTDSFVVDTEQNATITADLNPYLDDKVAVALPAKATIKALVTVKNTGTKILKKDEVVLSYKLFQSNGTKYNKMIAEAIPGQRDTSLPFDLPAGNSVSFYVTVSIPSVPTNNNNFKIVFDLKKGSEWLSVRGIKTAEKIFSVQDKYKASYSGRAPPSINTNTKKTFTVPITITNTGNWTWPSTGINAVKMSFHLYNQQSEAVIWNGDRTLLTHDVLPNQQITLNVKVTIPASLNSGIYTLSFDLVHEHKTWFSWKGIEPLSYPLAIRAYGQEGYWPFTTGTNLLNGNMVVGATDFSLSGRGPALSVSRSYNSLSNIKSLSGYNWRFSFESVLDNTSNANYAILKASDGGSLYFKKNSNGGYTPPPGVHERLNKNANGSFTLILKDKTKINYNSSGKLSSIVDTNNNVLTFNYSAGKVSSIVDASGRKVEIFYNGRGYVKKIRYPTAAGRNDIGYFCTYTSYTYNASDDLVKVVVDPSEAGYAGLNITTTYAYQNHKLVSITSPEGEITKFSYDVSDRLVAVESPLSTPAAPVKTTFVYNPDNKSTKVISPRGNALAVNNPNGYTKDDFTTTFTYNDFGNIVKVLNPEGLKTLTYWDKQNNVLAVDDYKATTINTYDDTTSFGWANVTKITVFDKETGFVNENYITYNANNYPVSSKDAKGDITTIVYDWRGNAINTTDATGITTYASYDIYGNPVYTTDGIAPSINLVANSNLEAGPFFSDNFNDGNYNGWTVAYGTWSIQNGVLQGKGSGNLQPQIHTNKSYSGKFIISADIKPSGGDAGIIWHVQNANNLYLLAIRTTNIEPYYRQNGVWHSLGAISTNLNPNTFYNIKVQVDSPRYKFYINNVFKGEKTESHYSHGKIGLRNLGSPSYFDNFKIMPNSWNWGWNNAGTSFDISTVFYSGKHSISQTHSSANKKSVFYTDTAKNSITPYKKYLISAYLRTDMNTADVNTNTGGVKIWAGFNKNDGTRLSDQYSQFYKTKVDTNGKGQWQRIYLVATAPKDAQRLRVHFLQQNFKGTTYIDAVSVEETTIISDYNVLENAGFETSQAQTGIANWAFSETNNTNISLINTKGINEDFYNLAAIPDDWKSQSGTWLIDSNNLKGVGAGSGVDAWIYIGNDTFADYIFEAKVIFVSNEASFVFRSTGYRQNEYRLDIFSNNFSSNPNYISLAKYKNGVYKNLVSSKISNLAPGLKVGGTANVRIEVIGNSLKIFINGIKVIYIIDPDPLLQGKVGLGVMMNWTARFDDVKLNLIGAENASSGNSYLQQNHLGNNYVSSVSNTTPKGTIKGKKDYTVSAYVKTEGFYDNFSEGRLSNFVPTSGIWKVENGELSGESGYIRTNKLYSDFTLEYKVKVVEGQETNIILRSDNLARNGYRVFFPYRSGSPKIRLFKYVNGKASEVTNSVSNSNFSITNNKWYQIKVVASGNNFKVYINNTLYLNATDNDTANLRRNKGFIVFGYPGFHSHYDNVKVSVSGGSGGAKVSVNFFNANGASLGTEVSSKVLQTNGKWQLIAFDASAPLNTSYATVKLIQQNFKGSTYFDSVRISKKISAKMTYDSKRNYVIKTEDALGNKVNTTYDNAGNVLTTTTHKTIEGVLTSSTTTNVYDTLSRLISTASPAGNQTDSNDYTTPTYVTTTYEYDKDSRLVKTTSPEGIVTTTTYLANGKVKSKQTTKNATPAKITSPASGTWTNNATPTINFSPALDKSVIAKYQLYVDGNLFQDDIKPNAASVTPSSPLANGFHNLYIVSVDGEGNTTKSNEIEINVDAQAPVVSITDPANSSIIYADTVEIKGKIFSPAAAISHVYLTFDAGASWQEADQVTNSSFSYTFNPQSFSNFNAYNVVAKAVNEAGGEGYSSASSIIVLDPATDYMANIPGGYASSLPVNTVDNGDGTWTTTVSPTADNHLYEDFAAYNFGNNSSLKLRDKAGYTRRSLLRFDFNSIPDGAKITNADLSLYYRTYYDNQPASQNVWAYRLTEHNWTEMGSNWNTYDGVNSWNTLGGDYTTVDGASASHPTTTDSWLDFNVTKQVKYAQSNLSSVSDFLIKFENENNLNYTKTEYNSKENASNWPKLEITYNASFSFSITSPVSGGWTSNPNPTVTWTPMADASFYIVFVDGYQKEIVTADKNSVTLSESLNNAVHEIQIVGVDTSGNVFKTNKLSFGVDTSAPYVTINSPANTSVVYGNSITIKGVASSLASPIVAVYVSTDGGVTFDLAAGTNSWSYTFNAPANGDYKIYVLVVNKVGVHGAADSSISVKELSPTYKTLRVLSKTTYEYDANGNTIATHNDPDGINQTTTATYDNMDRVLTQTDALGNTTINAYNNLGELISATDAKGNKTNFAYDGVGKKISTTDALGNTTYFNYDISGNLIGTTNSSFYSYSNSLDGSNNSIGGNWKIISADTGATRWSIQNNQLVSTYNGSTGYSYIADTKTNIGDSITTVVKADVYATTSPSGHTWGGLWYKGLYFDLTARWGPRDGSEQYAPAISANKWHKVKIVFTKNANGEIRYDSYLDGTFVQGRNLLASFHFTNNYLGVVSTYNGGKTYWDNFKVKTYGKNVAKNAQVIANNDGARSSLTDPNDYSALVDNKFGVANYIDTNLGVYPKPSLLIVLNKTYAIRSIKVYLYDNNKYGFKLESSLDNKNFKVLANKRNVSGMQEIFFNRPESIRFIRLTGTETSTAYNYFKVRELQAFTSAKTITQDYDGEDRLVSATDALGYTVHNYYNQSDELSFSVDAKQNVTSYEYDALGRKIRAIDPLGNYTSVVYDEAGNVIETFDQFGVKQKSATYDIAGKLRKTVNAIGHKTKMIYDLMGRATKSTSNRLNFDGSADMIITTSKTYGIFGRAKEAVDSLGYKTSQVYDSLSRVVEAWSKNANEYNPTHNTGNKYQPTRKTYYLDNKVSTITDPLGIILKNNYDANGNLASVIADYGKINQKTTFAYDALNRLKEVVDGRGNKAGAYPGNFKTTYTYDERGNKTSMTDSKGTTTYTYDNNNRLIAATDPLGNITNFIYDPEGLLISASNSAKKVSYEYDKNNHLTKEIYTTSGYEVSYEYDAKGRLGKITYPASTSTFAYDSADRLVLKTEGANTTSYEYNSHNNLTKITDSAGQVTVYEYNVRDELVSIKDGSNNTIASFTYDPNGNLLAKTLINGLTTAYTYDAANRLIGIKTTQANTTLNETSQSLGTLVYDNLDRITIFGANNYAYDLANELTSDNTHSYTYDGNGNMKTKGAVAYTYNNANQLVSDGIHTYTYDAGGSLTSDGVYTYVYDEKSRLTEVKQGANVIASYAYDASGRRVSKTVGAITTKYTYNDISKMLLSETVSGSTKSFRGVPGSYSQLISLDVDGATYYYVYDAIGQIIGLTDATGAWAVKYTYDSWGMPTEYDANDNQQAIGTFKNPYLYKTYYYDTETGLYYLNARYYSPQTARFITRDPLPGKASDRLGQNTYAYAENNPISKLDSDGRRAKTPYWNYRHYRYLWRKTGSNHWKRKFLDIWYSRAIYGSDWYRWRAGYWRGAAKKNSALKGIASKTRNWKGAYKHVLTVRKRPGFMKRYLIKHKSNIQRYLSSKMFIRYKTKKINARVVDIFKDSYLHPTRNLRSSRETNETIAYQPGLPSLSSSGKHLIKILDWPSRVAGLKSPTAKVLWDTGSWSLVIGAIVIAGIWAGAAMGVGVCADLIVSTGGLYYPFVVGSQYIWSLIEEIRYNNNKKKTKSNRDKNKKDDFWKDW